MVPEGTHVQHETSESVHIELGCELPRLDELRRKVSYDLAVFIPRSKAEFCIGYVLRLAEICDHGGWAIVCGSDGRDDDISRSQSTVNNRRSL